MKQRKQPEMRKPKRAVKLVDAHEWAEPGLLGAWCIEMPIRTVSENAYRREHWRTMRRRAKGQRTIAKLLLSRHVNKLPTPLTVILTRIAPRLLDDDNLRGSLKSVRDEIATWLGIDDGDWRVRYHYAQEKRGAYGVRAEVRQSA